MKSDDDGTGNKSCAATCNTSSECPTGKHCCAVIAGLTGKGACLANGATVGQQCRCAIGTECQSGTCAPTVDGLGNPTKPLVCKPNDGMPYNGCSSGTCTSGGCCLTVTSTGSQTCEKPCQMSSACGGAVCQPLTPGMCGTKLGSCVAN